MVNSVEEFLQIEIHQPLITFVHILLGFGDGRVTAAPGPKAVAAPVKGRLVIRAEHTMHGLLYETVDHIWDAKSSLSATRLGDPHAADHPRTVAAIQQLAMQRRHDLVEVRSHFADALPIGSGRAFVRRDLFERFSQIFFARYLLHRHRRWGVSRCGPRLRHRVRRSGGLAHRRSAVGPLRAVGCFAEQSELLHLLAGRGLLPSPLERLDAMPSRSGYDRLSTALWFYSTIRLLSSLGHLVLAFFDATARGYAANGGREISPGKNTELRDDAVARTRAARRILGFAAAGRLTLHTHASRRFTCVRFVASP